MLKNGARVLARLAGAACLMLAGIHTAQAEPLVDRAELEAWADSYYGRAIAERRNAGVTISVVQDGELLFSKGYGYADYGRKLPVDPERSGFVVGSITKTFVATAVLQLKERGKIASLDDPANKYLKRFQLAGERGAKVTVRHLLTHRAGLEDGRFGRLHPDAVNMPVPLPAKEIRPYLPDVVMEPGGPSNYSDWGFSILGLLIEDVSGQRFDGYLRANIFQPLGMAHTATMYPPAPDNRSEHYQFKADGTPVHVKMNPPHPFIVPAGAIVSTANDMARYMQAQMRRGEGEGPKLLSPAGFRELQTLQHRNAPLQFGFAHALWVGELNGTTTLEHGGGAPGFQSMMVMIPEKGFAFFVSSISAGLAAGEKQPQGAPVLVRRPPTGFELRESFVERFLRPAKPPEVEAKTDVAQLPGVYWTQQRVFSTVESLAGAFNPAAVLKVELSEDGKGVLLNGYGPYRDIGNGVFVSPAGRNVWSDPYRIDRVKPAYIHFTFGKDGKVRYLSPGLTDQVWAKASPVFNPKTMLTVAMPCAAIALTGLLMFLWPHRAGVLKRADELAALAAVAVFAIPAALFLGFPKGVGVMNHILAGDAGRLWIAVIAANVTALLAVGLAVVAGLAWRTPSIGWGQTARKVHLTLIALATLGLAVVFGFFRLLGVNIPGLG